MKYPDEHWQAVATCYKEQVVHPTELTGGKTVETVIVAKVQNHYPHVTLETVRAWVKRCRKDGLL